MQPVVLVVPVETGTASHKWVVAIANGVGGNIPKIRRRAWCCLPRHSDCLVSPNEDELRTVNVMRFDKDAVPAGGSRPRGQRGARSIVANSTGVDADASRIIN